MYGYYNIIMYTIIIVALKVPNGGDIFFNGAPADKKLGGWENY